MISLWGKKVIKKDIPRAIEADHPASVHLLLVSDQVEVIPGSEGTDVALEGPLFSRGSERR